MHPSPDRPRASKFRLSVFLTAAILTAYVAAGCGGEGGATGGADAAGIGSAPSASVSEAIRGPIDAGMADRGEELFRERGCAACHRMEDRLVGPAMSGVTARRDFAWFRRMVVNPDSMVRSDSTARAMLAEYMVPMPDQGITDEEARALFEYFRREDDVDGSSPPRPAADDRAENGGGSGQ